MAQSGIATALGLRGESPNKLKVPDAPYVDPTDVQQDTVAGNLAVLPDATKLARRTNEATSREYLAMMERLIPGFGQINKDIAGNIASMVAGQLPAGVENYLNRKAAERGVSRGTKGSQFDDYGALRDLGLTSLDLADRGLSSAQRWMQTVSSGAPMMNFTSMFLNPAQRIATEQWNEVNRFNTQFLRNQIKMLPSNLEMAGAQALDYVATWATTAASFGTSSMMGGGGQQQPSQQPSQPFTTGEMNNVYNSYGPGY